MSAYATDLGAYRTDLRVSLRAAGYDRWREREHVTTEERIADDARMMAVLHADGWNRYGWPETVGGLGGDERHRAALYDELSAAGLPVPEPHLMLETLGPPTVRFSPALAAELIPGYLAGQEWWGQGFSEPDAGSDLASLRCRARAEGDRYIVSGQKIWTSHGATAKRLFCLVRTGTPESRHRGLSMILIDADAQGVDVRPIALASGNNELAELFFDDVSVPASRLVGAEGQGWAVAMFLLQYERAMYAWIVSGQILRQLQQLRDAMSGRDLPDGAATRFGRAWSDVLALRARSASTVRTLAAGNTVGPEASVDKILLADAEIGVHDLVRDLLGSEFLFGSGSAARAWRAHWWYGRSATILGGSSEIQRTILADHVLGLPKEGR